MIGIVFIHTHPSGPLEKVVLVLVNADIFASSHKMFLFLHLTLGHWPKCSFNMAPAVALKTSVDAVFHHGDKLLVAQEAVPIVVKYLENCKKSSESLFCFRCELEHES